MKPALVVDVGYAVRPFVGETACGDRVVVVDAPASVLVAVVDGLGHGPHAALAADATERFVREHASLPLESLVRDCDRAIRHTRGVALTVVRIDRASGRLDHVAVGNVEVTSESARPVRPVALPGVVGARVRRVRQTSFALTRGDLVVLYSDGISSRLRPGDYASRGAQAIADAILRDYGKDHDDASCAVIAC